MNVRTLARPMLAADWARRYERWRLTRRIRAFERYCERLQAEREERWYSIAWLRERIQAYRATLAELERLP